MILCNTYNYINNLRYVIYGIYLIRSSITCISYIYIYRDL